jgi:hypothetical protein
LLEVVEAAIWRVCREDMLFFIRVFLEPAMEGAQPVALEARPV